DGWTSGRVLPAFLIAGTTLAAFVAWELRSDHPMLPPTLFRDRPFSTGTGVITIAFFLVFGFFFLATQYFQFVRGYSRPRVMAFGLAVVAGGLAVLTTLSPDTPYLVIAGALVLLAAGWPSRSRRRPARS